MTQAILQRLKKATPSKESPFYEEILEAHRTIERYRRYLKRVPFEGVLEIGFLPLGESLGYDNHPAYMIEDLELVRNCYNEAWGIFEETKSKKSSKNKKR